MGEVLYDTLPKSTLSYSLSPVGKGHVIAKRVWETKEAMLNYLRDSYDTAVPGLILVVTKDSAENNGAYLVKAAAGVDNVTPDQIGDNEFTITKLSTGVTETIQLSIAEDSQDLAYIEDNKLHITDMRSRWESKF